MNFYLLSGLREIAFATADHILKLEYSEDYIGPCARMTQYREAFHIFFLLAHYVYSGGAKVN